MSLGTLNSFMLFSISYQKNNLYQFYNSQYFLIFCFFICSRWVTLTRMTAAITSNQLKHLRKVPWPVWCIGLKSYHILQENSMMSLLTQTNFMRTVVSRYLHFKLKKKEVRCDARFWLCVSVGVHFLGRKS